MKISIKNRYNDEFTFTKEENGHILWEGDMKYCRFGMPNNYFEAYNEYCKDLHEINRLSLEDFELVVHNYDKEKKEYVYDKYVRLVTSFREDIEMIDPSGGPYIAANMDMRCVSNTFKGLIVKEFHRINTGYIIIIEQP